MIITDHFIEMASGSISGSSNPSGSIEKMGSTGDRDVPSSKISNVESEISMGVGERSQTGEQFLASDSFYHRMKTMVNKEDVQSILDKQKET